MKDQIAGVFLGCALGDSLGKPFEFRFHKNNIYTGILYIAPEYHFQFSHRTETIGSYSDDTEMTICNIRAIIESNGEYDREKTIKKYQEWAVGAKSMGKNTRKLFKGVKTLKGYEKRYDTLYGDTDESTWSQSNGSLMRCSILSFFGEDTIIADCKLTNPHPINIDSGRLYSYLIRSVANDVPTEKILKKVRKMDLHKDVILTFEEAISSKKIKRDITGKNKGWVLNSLFCACWAWFYAKSFQDGIDVIIRLGGDTDTNAAIAGALMGAKFGAGILYQEERTKQNIEIMLTADSSEGDNPLPEWLRLNDFFEIVEKLDELINNNC